MASEGGACQTEYTGQPGTFDGPDPGSRRLGLVLVSLPSRPVGNGDDGAGCRLRAAVPPAAADQPLGLLSGTRRRVRIGRRTADVVADAVQLAALRHIADAPRDVCPGPSADAA